jgi:isoleucyl-tRNA synthetase
VGNVVDSQAIIEKHGAEILRLWVAAEDYTEDIRISEEILKRLVEAYRRIRNTCRFILGNLYDFDCAADMVPYESMEELDRFALNRLEEVLQRVKDAYERFQFHVVYYTIYNFCTVDLSALYLDVLKDRLYTSQAASQKRRSAQSAMYLLLHKMTRLLAPILTFTAEEIWAAMPDYEGKEASVHLTQLPEATPACVDPALMERWKTMLGLRMEISKAIEVARQNKTIGHSLDAFVEIAPPEDLRSLLETYRQEMRSLLIVSGIDIVGEDAILQPYDSSEITGLKIGVTKAPGQKCGRCWIYSPSVGADPLQPDVCERCLDNLA